MRYERVARAGRLATVQVLGVKAAYQDILRLVARQGLLPVWIGLGVGGAASFALARLLAGLLYGVEPTDPGTYTLVALGVVTVAILACWAPAARALRLDPTRALRAE